MQRPQKVSDILLNIGDAYGRPQAVHASTGGISPGVNSEIINDGGVLTALLYDDGTDKDFVLVRES